MKITLYQPDIAGNLGAVMRLCACFNVPLEVIEPCGFPLTTKSLRRTAMDYGAPESVIRHKTWTDFQKAKGNERFVLFTTKAATPLPAFKFEPDDNLLFGRESQGVPDAVHEAADARILIPMHKSARSINLANAASIALFEALRQTGQLP